MDILYLLIPLSVLGVFGVMAVFAWALHKGQFDDLEREGERIFNDGTALPANGRRGENTDDPSAVARGRARLDADQAGR